MQENQTPNGSSSFVALLPDISADVIAGLVTLVYSISFAALIFSGSLAAYFLQGLGVALLGATVTAIMVAWHSAFPFALAGPESTSAVLLALMASAIAKAELYQQSPHAASAIADQPCSLHFLSRQSFELIEI